jgi:LuxR family transcriptional regulator, maltose regulon positive regulatory protein
MPHALVETKFFVPPTRPGLVPRPRLDQVLGSTRTRLILVSAPAGFGKTTLLAAWLAGAAGGAVGTRRTAWVSLDEADTGTDAFWSYVLTALERAAPGAGAGGLALLGTGQPIEAVLATVLNELSVQPDDVDLVLDDYHLADGPGIQPGMAFLLERLPPQVRLIIGTRADPALPLARLRARGELTEVRAAELRFTRDETTAYLADATGLELDARDVSALEARTEGWIASLQLAAISLRDRDDPSRFIAGFAGDDRYVVDYLVEEVLDHQSDQVRDFLLGTAILDRLTGPLCDAVTETSGSGQVLESLERRNLFVVPLDDQRRWYRYHHLFADVLRAHLLTEQPERAPGLHRRASAWFQEAGEPVPAVRHALAAGDVERAAELVELAVPELGRARREDVIRGWADAFPDEVLRNRPVLAMRLVGGFMASNEFAGVAERLDDIERQLGLPEDELVVVDRDELSRLPAAVEMYRSALALNAGDPAGTIAHAERALERATARDDLTRASAAALSGLASWTTGDLDAAYHRYSAAMTGLEQVGHLADVLGCSIAVADIAITQGRLGDAQLVFERALQVGGRESPGLRGMADMHVGLSEVARARNDLDAAAAHLRRGEELGEAAELPQNPYRRRVAAAGLARATGDLDLARSLLEEAVRVYVGDYSPDVRPVPARLARVQVALGDLASAREWARSRGVGAADELAYLREYEHVTLARLLLAEHALEGSEPALRDAMGLLDRLAGAAEAGGRTGNLIEVLALGALAHRAGGDQPGALDTLERAVTLAEPEGHVRVFLDEGEPMTALIGALAERRPELGYVRDLAGAGQRPGTGSPPPPRTAAPVNALVDPLSERELVVLRLLASDLDGPSIARELVVSLNTVRTHTKHVYAKLGVNNRRSAVSRAHQLGLLAR